MILHPCSIIVNTPPKKKCKQTLRRIIIFGGSPGQCGPCGPCLQPASRWQGPEGHVARTTLGRSCGPPRLNWMVTTGNIYRKQWLFSGSKMDFVWILINGSYPNMIKYASFMITLQNGNHGSTDLMESCTIKGGNGRSPSWMEDFDGKIILKSEISMPPLIPGGSFPWIPSHFIPYYIGYTYIAHMSTYVYIYIRTILHPQYDISSSACWGSRPSTSISLSKAGSAGRNSASLKLSVPRLCRIQW